MTFFRKAERTQQKLRLALEGPSGSGKTFSALAIARGLVGPQGIIAVGDTENGSASLYSDKFDFFTVDIKPPFHPDKFVQVIEEAERGGIHCLILDSITHEWTGAGGMLDIHDKMPGNSWTNWAKCNPIHDRFINAMLQCNIHIIATMRSKQTHVQEDGDNGKKVIRKAGMAPQQRDGLDYEFTSVLYLDISHQARGDKDRTGLFPTDRWFLPGEDTGQMLAQWLGQGSAPVQQQHVQQHPQQQFYQQ